MIWKENPNIRNWLPTLQAHRGYWIKGLPQNSLESIAEAKNVGYQMCEIDVRLTKDNCVILFHDDTINDVPISDLYFSDLNNMQKTNSLSEVLLWLRSTENFKLNIEIKSGKMISYNLEKEICRLIELHSVVEKVMISSFNPLSLFKIKILLPDVYRALLLSFEDNPKNSLLLKSGFLNYLCEPHILNIRHDDYSVFFKNLSKKIPIVLWTVNEIEIYDKHKNEVHGIISDKITPQDFKKN